MAIGTPFHERTAPLNLSLNWREWSGYFAAGHYRNFHQPEYAAIRNGVALIDVSPLYKYSIRGRHAEILIDRVITRNASKQKVGQVIYTPWCDSEGKVLQEGTVLRLAPEHFLLSATEHTLRWLQMNAIGLEVEVEEVSKELAGLAVQGPNSRALLSQVTDGPVAALPFFHLLEAHISGVPVTISRTGYTGDLGYELWIPADRTLPVWDALMAEGKAFGVTPCGILALDIARIEAGFVLYGVDYVSAEKARIPSQKSSPFELGMGWAVKLKKKIPCTGQEALAREKKEGSTWQFVGLEVEWDPLEALFAEVGLMPDLPTVAWRDAVPVYVDGDQVGRATSGCWSTLLKKYIALTTLESRHATPGNTVDLEITVDYTRKTAPAKVVQLPFFRPSRMRA